MSFYWFICALVWLITFLYVQDDPKYVGSPIAEQTANVLTATTIALLWPLGLVVAAILIASKWISRHKH
jgi:hypothetical protein